MNNSSSTALIVVPQPPRRTIIDDLIWLVSYYYEEFMMYLPLYDDVVKALPYVFVFVCWGIVANLVLHFFLYYLMNNSCTDRPLRRKRILLVTAHPGDEALYFGPTVMRLRNDCDVYILCFTNGNNKGVARQRELWASCATLGIRPSNITMLNNERFPDDPTVYWSAGRVCKILIDHIERLRIEEVYTFDIDGINGDRNNASIFYGFAYMLLFQQVPDYCSVYLLDTVMWYRKFATYMDVPLTFLSPHDVLYMVEFGEASEIREAIHEYELVGWCRFLYMSCNRYIYFNTYKKLQRGHVHLAMRMAGCNPSS